jgi:hypothetical protein
MLASASAICNCQSNRRAEGFLKQMVHVDVSKTVPMPGECIRKQPGHRAPVVIVLKI